MKKHALISPSAAHRISLCAGSVALSIGAPDSDSSKYADEGTTAAWVVEKLWNDQSAALLGVVAPNGYVVDQDMIKHAQSLISYIGDILSFGDDWEVFNETPFSLESVTGEAGAEGTPDFVLISPAEQLVIVLDYKYGVHNVVEAEDNEQLMLYTAAVLEHYALVYELKHTQQIIYQPRANNFPIVNSTAEYILASAREFRVKADAARGQIVKLQNGAKLEELDLTPGEKQCRWCKAKPICPALASAVNAVVPKGLVKPLEFDDLDNGTYDTYNKADKHHNLLSFQLTNIPLINIWIKSIEAYAILAARAGEKIPGFKLVLGREGNREWLDEEEVEKTLEAMKVPKDMRYVSKLISPTVAAKLVDKGVLTPRKWAKLEEKIHRSPAKTILVPVDDKREAVTTALEFDMLEESKNAE